MTFESAKGRLTLKFLVGTLFILFYTFEKAEGRHIGPSREGTVVGDSVIIEASSQSRRPNQARQRERLVNPVDSQDPHHTLTHQQHHLPSSSSSFRMRQKNGFENQRNQYQQYYYSSPTSLSASGSSPSSKMDSAAVRGEQQGVKLRLASTTGTLPRGHRGNDNEEDAASTTNEQDDSDHHKYHERYGGQGQGREEGADQGAESEDELGRYSLVNSYFDNDYSLNMLHSMECVTPARSQGYCSTFRSCVPSLFTSEGELEAPALAELVAFSIGFCTMDAASSGNVLMKRTGHRFTSVANRIICCPGTPPKGFSSVSGDNAANKFNDLLAVKGPQVTAFEEDDEHNVPLSSLPSGSVPIISPNKPASGLEDSSEEQSHSDNSQEQTPVQESINSGQDAPGENVLNNADNLTAAESPSTSEELHIPSIPIEAFIPPEKFEDSYIISDPTSTGVKGNLQGQEQGQFGSPSGQYDGPVGQFDTSAVGQPDDSAEIKDEVSASNAQLQTGSEASIGLANNSEEDSSSASTPSNSGTEYMTESYSNNTQETSNNDDISEGNENSTIIKLTPEPVIGANGKFTLEKGVHVEKATSETPRPRPNPAHQTTIGETTVNVIKTEATVDSNSILVTNNTGHTNADASSDATKPGNTTPKLETTTPLVNENPNSEKDKPIIDPFDYLMNKYALRLKHKQQLAHKNKDKEEHGSSQESIIIEHSQEDISSSEFEKLINTNKEASQILKDKLNSEFNKNNKNPFQDSFLVNLAIKTTISSVGDELQHTTVYPSDTESHDEQDLQSHKDTHVDDEKDLGNKESVMPDNEQYFGSSLTQFTTSASVGDSGESGTTIRESFNEELISKPVEPESLQASTGDGHYDNAHFEDNNHVLSSSTSQGQDDEEAEPNSIQINGQTLSNPSNEYVAIVDKAHPQIVASSSNTESMNEDQDHKESSTGNKIPEKNSDEVDSHPSSELSQATKDSSYEPQATDDSEELPNKFYPGQKFRPGVGSGSNKIPLAPSQTPQHIHEDDSLETELNPPYPSNPSDWSIGQLYNQHENVGKDKPQTSVESGQALPTVGGGLSSVMFNEDIKTEEVGNLGEQAPVNNFNHVNDKETSDNRPTDKHDEEKHDDDTKDDLLADLRDKLGLTNSGEWATKGTEVTGTQTENIVAVTAEDILSKTVKPSYMEVLPSVPSYSLDQDKVIFNPQVNSEGSDPVITQGEGQTQGNVGTETPEEMPSNDDHNLELDQPSESSSTTLAIETTPSSTVSVAVSSSKPEMVFSQIIENNSQPGLSTTTEAPVSSAPDAGGEADSSEVSINPAKPSEDNQPAYQILSACATQDYYRSLEEDNSKQYPWLATIVGGSRPFCSGTLITDRHVLTAAHFLSNITVSDVFHMRVHVGYKSSPDGRTEGPYAVRKVLKVIRHKGFSFDKLTNDIAILILDRPIRFSEDVHPVCLSNSPQLYSTGVTEAFETGWVEDPMMKKISPHHPFVDPHILKYFTFGSKNVTWTLQDSPTIVRTQEDCQNNYAFLEKSGIGITDSMVCAAPVDGAKSCSFKGNSGAPLFLKNDGKHIQIGLVSWGIGCGHFPAVFTGVSSFLPWIEKVVYRTS